MNQEYGAAQTKADPRSEWQQKLDAARKETRWQAYLFYCRWFYRAHMRWLHKRGRHKWKHFGPLDGIEFDKCEWCGAMQHPNGSGVFPAGFRHSGREHGK